MATGRHGANKDSLIGGVLLHPHTVAEDRSTGEGARRVDGQNSDCPERVSTVEAPGVERFGNEPVRQRGLTGPGRTGDANDVGSWGAIGLSHGLSVERSTALDVSQKTGERDSTALARLGEEFDGIARNH